MDKEEVAGVLAKAAEIGEPQNFMSWEISDQSVKPEWGCVCAHSTSHRP